MILVLCCAVFLIYRLCTLWPTRHERTRTWWIGAVSALVALGGIGYGLVTDIVAQKALAFLLMPAGLAWLMLIAVTVVAWIRAGRLLGLLASGALALFTMAGNAWVGDWLIGTLEQQIPALDLEGFAPCDAVFVLGGGTEVSDANGPQLSNGGDRIALAARLWHAGKAKRLVASGSSIGAMETERDLAAETAALWRGLGVAPEAIIQIPPGRVNTTQEIAAYATLIRERGWTRVGLISSAWHLPRALRLCRAQNLDLIPVGADRRGRFRSWSPIWLIPQNHGFERVQHACWEYLGMISGR
jgi:uncharacterized SAM-binding protein YcdF (DUF218 family)